MLLGAVGFRVSRSKQKTMLRGQAHQAETLKIKSRSLTAIRKERGWVRDDIGRSTLVLSSDGAILAGGTFIAFNAFHEL